MFIKQKEFFVIFLFFSFECRGMVSNAQPTTIPDHDRKIIDRIALLKEAHPELNIRQIKDLVMQEIPLTLDDAVSLYNAAIATSFSFGAQCAAYAISAQKLPFWNYEEMEKLNNKPHKSMYKEVGKQNYLFAKSPMHDRKYFSVRELADHECEIEEGYEGETLKNNCLSNRVNSLDGINRFSRLTEIRCQFGKIVSVEPEHLHGLTQLKTLSLSKHQISSIRGIEQLITLTKLDLFDNSLTNAALCLSRLQALTYLDLSFNRLTNLAPLAALTRLQTLNVTGNQLIELSENELRPHQQLTSLDASHNYNAENKKAIAHIDGVYLLTNLRTLHLRQNSIASIAPTITNLRSLQEIDLDETNITSLGTLVNVTSLTDLSVRHAKITQVTPEEIEQLQKMTGLTSLYLGGNHIPKETKTHIKEALPHVKWVNFSSYMHPEEFQNED